MKIWNKNKQCEYCQKAYQAKFKKQKYCSPICAQKGTGLKRRRFDESGRVCNVCGVKKPISEFTVSGEKSKNKYPAIFCKKCKPAYSANFKTDPIKRRKRQKRYYDEIEKNDPTFRLNRTMRVGICNELRKRNGRKNGRSWKNLVPYTIGQLKCHLEKKFLPGMTWDNYGEWHIDHIVPRDAFNFSSSNHIDFKRCWAMENLRPLWKTDNLRKGKKLNAQFQPTIALGMY